MRKKTCLYFFLIFLLILFLKPPNVVEPQTGEGKVNEVSTPYQFQWVIRYSNASSHSLNATRAAIFETIVSDPGIHFRGICRELGLSVGVVQYHLRVLEESGEVESFMDGKYKRFFENRRFTEEDKKVLSELRHPLALKIVLSLFEADDITHMRLARTLGVSSQVITWHMGNLVDSGLVESSRGNGRTKYKLTVYGYQKISRMIKHNDSKISA